MRAAADQYTMTSQEKKISDIKDDECKPTDGGNGNNAISDGNDTTSDIGGRDHHSSDDGAIGERKDAAAGVTEKQDNDTVDDTPYPEPEEIIMIDDPNIVLTTTERQQKRLQMQLDRMRARMRKELQKPARKQNPADEEQATASAPAPAKAPRSNADREVPLELSNDLEILLESMASFNVGVDSIPKSDISILPDGSLLLTYDTSELFQGFGDFLSIKPTNFKLSQQITVSDGVPVPMRDDENTDTADEGDDDDSDYDKFVDIKDDDKDSDKDGGNANKTPEQ